MGADLNISPRLMVIWRILEYCNLGCEFCEYNKNLIRPRKMVDEESVLRFGELLSRLSEVSGREIIVSWIGGEPFLWPPIIAVAKQFKSTYGLKISATTNGSFPHVGNILSHIAECYDEITFSLDGVKEHHDLVRNQDGLYLKVESAIRNLRRLRSKQESGPVIRVNTVLMKDNINQFREFCHGMVELGVDEISFNILGGSEESEFYRAQRLTAEDVGEFRQCLIGVRDELRGDIKILGAEDYLMRLMLQASGINVPIINCGPGEKQLFIDEAGNIGPCSFTAGLFSENISNIRTVEELRGITSRMLSLKLQHLMSPCYDCHSTNVFGKFDGTSKEVNKE